MLPFAISMHGNKGHSPQRQPVSSADNAEAITLTATSLIIRTQAGKLYGHDGIFFRGGGGGEASTGKTADGLENKRKPTAAVCIKRLRTYVAKYTDTGRTTSVDCRLLSDRFAMWPDMCLFLRPPPLPFLAQFMHSGWRKSRSTTAVSLWRTVS